ncbi:MAG: fumarylacetoacetate hydrolase family protein [Pseudomonadota bacterium]
MGVSVSRVQHEDFGERWAVVHGDEFALLPDQYPTHRELLDDYRERPERFEAVALPRVPAGETQLRAPISADVQIFCQGLNYASHREEGGASRTAAAKKGQNLIFSKPPSSICGPRDAIVRPRGCELLDYEVELGLVMRRDIAPHANITEANLLDYVGGITLANDVSARDFMFGAPMLQWFKGKGQRTFCPLGPTLYLLGEGDDDLLNHLRLTLALNGEIRQDATTDLLIHKPAETLTELAGFTDVRRGDLLLTGTPGGVILNATPKVGLAILINFTNDERRRRKLIKSLRGVRFLQPGDKLRLTLTSRDGTLDLGHQASTIVDAGST